MAITNAQQYQQLVNKSADGKRPGYRGIGGYQEGKSAPSSKSSSSSKSSGYTGGVGGGKDASTQSFDKSLNPNRPGGPIGRDDSGATPPQEYIGGTAFDVSPQTKEEQEKKNFAISLENDRRRVEARKQKLKEISFLDNLGMLGYTRRTKDANLEELGMIDPQTMRIAGYEMPNILSGITSAITVDPSTDYFDIDSIREIGGVLSKSPTGITKTQANTLGDLRQDIQMEDRINNPDDRVTQSEFEEYMNRNKVILPEGGGGDQPILTPYQEDVVEDEVDPDSLEGILANRGIAYRFMANGGRAGYQQGGEIMPRLNQLGSGLSSAEQTLQEINQRLQSAESTLGEGGGNTAPIGSGFMQPVSMNNSQAPDLRAIPEFMKDPSYQPKQAQLLGMRPGNIPGTDAPYSSLRGSPLQHSSGLYQFGPGRALTPGQSNADGSISPMQSPLATAIGLASGGRVGLMGGGMPYEGGIMDLESARQMYGLGKLVKKATGAIKKIVKSPVGKAALLYFGGNALMNKSGGLGIKDFLTRAFLGKEVSGGALAGRGRTGGILQFMKDNPLLTIAGGSTLAGLLSSSGDEDETQPYYRGPGLDIDAIRRDPYGTKGSAYGFYAEGGDVKEPVAKDTMPLLDMDGMEKDYRADGGFVPIGRMEKADDVPARLSKNEFVFTADAVRNAGDGDIDKGAEVMYNVMKNLEAGGNISEESQGLNGARNMFQTSKRLEEVL